MDWGSKGKGNFSLPCASLSTLLAPGREGNVLGCLIAEAESGAHALSFYSWVQWDTTPLCGNHRSIMAEQKPSPSHSQQFWDLCVSLKMFLLVWFFFLFCFLKGCCQIPNRVNIWCIVLPAVPEVYISPSGTPPPLISTNFSASKHVLAVHAPV